MERKNKPVVVHMPSSLMKGELYEHKLPSEDDLYQDMEFVKTRISNLEVQLEEMEMSMALAAERHEYFIKSGTTEEDEQLKATMEMIVEIDKEYEFAKKELADLRAHLLTLE